MDMQNVAKLDIPEGEVRTIHNKDGNLIWGKVSYGVKYKGDTAQNGTPTPSAPVAVQTVTGENVVQICGKNLCSSAWENGAYNTTTGAKASGSGYRTADFVAVQPNTTYIVSRASSGVAMNILEYNSSKVFTYYKGDATSSGSSFTTKSDTYYITMYRGASGGINDMMLEKGSIISTYEPYQGQSYEVNLGNIELCGLGDDGAGGYLYQDYIYKNLTDDKWYVHKDFGKVVFTGSAEENWFKSGSSTSSVLVAASNVLSLGVKRGALNECRSDYFAPSSSVAAGTFGLFDGTSSYRFIRLCVDASTYTDITAFTNWLNSHNTTFYYALTTPTNTEITDEALVAQLEAVEQWLTRYGYNATVSGNLPIIIDRTAL